MPVRDGRVTTATQRRIAAAVVTAAVATAVFWTLATSGAAAATTGAAADAVVVAPFESRSADQLIDRLEAAGADPRLVLLPHTVVAGVPAAAAERLRGDGFTVLRAASDAPAGADAATRRALDLLDVLASPQPWVATRDDGGDLPPLTGDVRRPWTGVSVTRPGGASADVDGGPLSAAALLDPLTAARGGAPVSSRGLPKATEPAAYAAGSVAVSIIFTESNGARETDREDWSDADPSNPGDRRSAVTDRIMTALAWWAAQQQNDGLVFVLPASGSPGATRTVSTGYEPVRHAGVADAVWRHPLMKSLGYPAEPDDVPPPEAEYDDAVRSAAGTDWAFTIYVVDSLHDSDGAFSDGLFAYTFALYGPYTVVTYDVDGYGAEDLSPVLAHEVGHIFGALDEYAPPVDGYPSTGDLFSGYLWVRNRNAVVGGTTDYACLMRGGAEALQAYVDGEVCPSTHGQVGWRDLDDDGVPDVVDTLPRLSDGPQTETTGQVTLSGVAAEVPFPRGRNARGSDFTHDISVFVPHDVVYSVDGGASLPAAAADGAFDRPAEAWTLTTGALSAGHHVVTLSATTGATATLTRDVWVGPVPVSLTLTTARTTLLFGRSLEVEGTATSGGYPVPFLSGIGVGLADDEPLKLLAADRLGGWSGSVKPRFSGDLVATFESSGQYVGPAVSSPVTIGVRPVIRARLAAATIARGKVMGIDGTFRPQRGGVPLVLQITRNGSAWSVVKSVRTRADGNFHFGYKAARRGSVRLRVRFAGDEKNLSAVRPLPAFVVR
jgi:hypothetical protein